MWEIISMWKSPKMVALVLLTALLYAASIFPFRGFTAFGGYIDFGRIGVGIPVAFSFLFGPAAAWGAAIGNVFRDIVESHLDASSFFGFAGNFILGYVPYKLWRAVTAEKPDMRNIRKLLLFIGITIIACVTCGLTIGWGVYWLGFIPFMPTAAIIAFTNALWVIIVGPIVLALAYFVSKRKMFYVDAVTVKERTSYWNKSRRFAIVTFVVITVACFAVGQFLNLNPLILLPLIVLSLIAVGLTCK